MALREWTHAHGPLLLLLEDFCAADVLSWSLLARCAREAPTVPLVILVTLRPQHGLFSCMTPVQAHPPAPACTSPGAYCAPSYE